MSVKYPNYVNLTSSSGEQPNERTPSPPPRKKSLLPPQAPSKSISSKSTHYTSSSSPSESPTPTHVAPPPKLRFVILIKQELQELSPLQISPNDPYAQTMDNWPSDLSNPSPPLPPPMDLPNTKDGSRQWWIPGDIIRYAFLASRLQTSDLQAKILMMTGIESHGSSFKHALDTFNTTCNVDVLSVTTCTSAPQMMKTLTKCYFGVIEKDLVSKLAIPMFSVCNLCPSCNAHLMDQWEDHAVHCSSEVDHGEKGGFNGFPLEGRKGSTPCRPLLRFNWLQGKDACLDVTASLPLLSQMEEHTSGWLRVVPISRLGQTMIGRTYWLREDSKTNNQNPLSYEETDRSETLLSRTSFPFPLFCTLIQSRSAACSRVFAWNIYGDHVVSCTGSSPLTQTGMIDFLPRRTVTEASQPKRLKYEAKLALCSSKVAYASCNAQRMDRWGDHVVQCLSEVDVKFRHNLVHDILVDICSKVGIMVRKEAQIGFLSEDGNDLRPADLLLFNWLQSKDACLDVTDISPFPIMGATS
nr:pentatricopeptide repeat (PPR) superfamily protein [Tanacetum cinerariifolium]